MMLPNSTICRETTSPKDLNGVGDMKTIYSDCIHGRVIIEDDDKEFLGFCQKELDRLQRIKQLGIISEFHLGANHSKLEQTLGLYYLVCKLLSSKKVRGINEEALRRVAIIRAIGHLPMTFSSEKGMLRAAFVESNIRRKLVRVLRRVEMFLGKGKCEKCGFECRNNIIQSSQVFDLHKWLSAHKFIDRIVPMMERQGVESSKIVHETLEYLVCRHSMGHDIIARMNELDYVTRDMHYTGVLSVSVDTDALLAEVKTSASKKLIYPKLYREILSSAKRYLQEKVYEEPNAVALSSVLENVVAQEIVSGKLEPRSLLDADDFTFFSLLSEKARDEYDLWKERCVTGQMCEVTRISAARVQDEEFWNRNKIEKKVFNTLKKDLIRVSLTKGLYIRFVTESPGLPPTLAVIHNPQSKEISPLITVLSRLERVGEYAEISLIDLVRYLFGKEDIEIEASQVRKILETVLESRRELMEQFEAKRGERASHTGLDVYIKADGELISLGDPLNYLVYLIQKEKRVNILIETLINRPSVIKRRFLKKLGKEVLRHKFDSELEGAQHETLAFLKELHSSVPEIDTKWVLPGVVFNREDGTKEGEVDVISIILFKDGGVQVRLIECSVSRSGGKYQKDVRKSIDRKEQMLSRFHDDDRFSIECEIVGPSAPVNYTKTRDLKSYFK